VRDKYRDDDHDPPSDHRPRAGCRVNQPKIQKPNQDHRERSSHLRSNVSDEANQSQAEPTDHDASQLFSSLLDIDNDQSQIKIRDAGDCGETPSYAQLNADRLPEVDQCEFGDADRDSGETSSLKPLDQNESGETDPNARTRPATATNHAYHAPLSHDVPGDDVSNGMHKLYLTICDN